MGDIGDNMFVGADACRQNLRYGCIGNYWEAPVNRPGGVGVPFVGYVAQGQGKSEDTVFVIYQYLSEIPGFT